MFMLSGITRCESNNGISVIASETFKGAICKNVAKNGYYTEIQNTAQVVSTSPSRLAVARAVGVSSVSLLFLPQ